MSDLLFFFAILIVLFLPGTVWQLVVRPGKMDPLERITEAAAASLALTGLVALFLFLGGQRISAGGVVGLYLAILTIGLLVVLLRGMKFKFNAWYLLAAGAFLGVVTWRLYQVHGLVLPVWVDSVHHTLLVRKIIEYGGLPPDWLPYLPVPMYYHFGFHVITAVFSFWSGLQPDQAVLLFGQVMNALVAFSVYRLTKAAWGDPLRAGLAGLFTAFAFHMPAYYLTWGRYTLLAGLVVLPLAMAAALEVRRSPSDKFAWARLILYSAAVCFCHFLAVGLLVLFLLILFGAEIVVWVRTRSISNVRWQPFAASAFGALLVSPWLARVWDYTHQMFAIQVPDPLDPTLAAASAWDYIIYLTGPERSHILLIAAGVGLVLGLIHGRARLIAIWGLLIAIMATPYGPRFEPFRPDHLAIILFLPGSLLLAELVVTSGEGLTSLISRFKASFGSIRVKTIFSMILPLVIGAGLALWGIWETADIVNPVTVLANSADVKALKWVNENMQSSARFFINATPWQGTILRGTDGGYWIMPYTGRFTVVLPVAYAFGNSEDTQRFLDWSKRASEITDCDQAFWSLVKDARLNSVYIHDGQGSLQRQSLESCRGVDKIYDREGVSIYKLTPY